MLRSYLPNGNRESYVREFKEAFSSNDVSANLGVRENHYEIQECLVIVSSESGASMGLTSITASFGTHQGRFSMCMRKIQEKTGRVLGAVSRGESS